MPRNPTEMASIGPDVTLLHFPRSDGSRTEGKHPQNTVKVVDVEGHVNFLQPVSEDNIKYSTDWRIKVGMPLARALNMPAGKYALAGWPEGYQMYDHHKGPEKEPRHDPYLHGSKTVTKFRSANEFYPHAEWLFTDETMDLKNCKCKYCTKNTQRDISAALGLSKPSASSTPRPARAPGPFASIRRKPATKPKKDKPLESPEQSVSRDRDADLRASYPPGKPPIRQYRKNELVWCFFRSPIRGPNSPSTDILAWPGLVRGVKIKKDIWPNPRAPPEPSIDLQAVRDASFASQADIIDMKEPVEPPWLTKDIHVFDIKFLGCSFRREVESDELLPFQAWTPSNALLAAMKDLSVDSLNMDTDAISKFNPMPSDTANGEGSCAPSWRETVPAFTLAAEIASNIANFWCPTDVWTFTMALPSAQAASLAEAVNHMSQSNSTSTSASVLPKADNNGASLTQTRYQGLWWGPERIWMDDVVRLKFHRSQIGMADHILPVSGPSEENARLQKQDQSGTSDDVSELGAGPRGVLLRVEAIFAVFVPDGDSSRPECRVSGTLYEVADEGWDELDEDGQKTPVPDVTPLESFGTASLLSSNPPPDAASSLISPHQVSSATLFHPKPVSETEPSLLSNESASNRHTPPLRSLEGVSARAPPPTAASIPTTGTNAQLSHGARHCDYPLPIPPMGYKFRPILTPGFEAVLSPSVISGRYYPGLLNHPQLRTSVQEAVNNTKSQTAITLWSLECLGPGFDNANDPTEWKESRSAMVKRADEKAKREIRAHWDSQRQMQLAAALNAQYGSDKMDVDPAASG